MPDRLTRWISRQIRGENPAGPASPELIAYVQGRTDSFPVASELSDGAIARAAASLGRRTLAQVEAGRPDAVDALAERAAVEQSRER